MSVPASEFNLKANAGHQPFIMTLPPSEGVLVSRAFQEASAALFEESSTDLDLAEGAALAG